jgi:hypothetical protein
LGQSVAIESGELYEKEAGLWIDHRKAVIVIATDSGEEIPKGFRDG